MISPGPKAIGILLVLVLAFAGALTGYLRYGASAEYRSEAFIGAVASQVREDVAHVSPTGRLEERLATMSISVFSRARFERMILDLNLYAAERAAGQVMQDIIELMRGKIDLRVEPARAGNNPGGFWVRFRDSDPRKAQQVAERLAASFLQESQRRLERETETSSAFIESQLVSIGQRLTDTTERLARTKTGADAARVQLEAEAIRDSYKALLAKREQALMIANLQRLNLGGRLILFEPARLPERPIGPSRGEAAMLGALAGIALGLMVNLFVGVRRALSVRAAEVMAQGS